VEGGACGGLRSSALRSPALGVQARHWSGGLGATLGQQRQLLLLQRAQLTLHASTRACGAAPQLRQARVPAQPSHAHEHAPGPGDCAPKRSRPQPASRQRQQQQQPPAASPRTLVRCQICFSSAPRDARPMASASAAKAGSASMGTWPSTSWTTSGSGVYIGRLAWRMYCVLWKYLWQARGGGGGRRGGWGGRWGRSGLGAAAWRAGLVQAQALRIARRLAQHYGRWACARPRAAAARHAQAVRGPAAGSCWQLLASAGARPRAPGASGVRQRWRVGAAAAGGVSRAGHRCFHPRGERQEGRGGRSQLT
jgi:hypothetical protein